MSFVLLGILNSQASGVAQAYFLSLLGGASTENSYAVTSDTSNNVYAVGEQRSEITTASREGFLVKHLPNGSISFQKSFGDGEVITEFYSIKSDSSGNTYIAGFTELSTAVDSEGYFLKLDSNGNVILELITDKVGDIRFLDLDLDDSENIYTTAINGQQTDILKLNTSGSVIFAKSILDNNSSFDKSVALDSNNNIYSVFTGKSPNRNDNLDASIVKFNSSGVVQWQRFFGGSAKDNAASFGGGIKLDSFGNLYIIGRTESEGQGSFDGFLAKYNSSGSLQWQKIMGTVAFEQLLGIDLDSSNNVFVCGRGGTGFFVAKFDSDGIIQWQREIGETGFEEAKGISIDNNENVLVTGVSTSAGSGSTDFFTIVIPNDGSLTGTYNLGGVNYVYQASSLVVSTSTLTSGTSDYSITDGSYTMTAANLSKTTTTFTQELTEIG